MKKKILSLLLGLFLCLSVFTGCSLVEQNDKNYQEAVVATLTYKDGTTQNILKRDLIASYNSYGYNYEQNGMDRKAAIKETLNTMVDRFMTIKAVEDYYAKNPSEGKMLIGSETTYIWDETYNALYANIESYLNRSSSQQQTEQENEKAYYTPFVRKAQLVEGEHGYEIQKSDVATTVRNTYVERSSFAEGALNYDNAKDKEAMYNKIQKDLGDSKTEDGRLWRDAFNSYVEDIKKSYSYKNFASNKDAFSFEMDRIYNIVRDNYLVQKYSTIFDYSKQDGSRDTNVTPEMILNEYSARVREDYSTYKVLQGKTTFESDVLKSDGSVDYVLSGNDVANYFSVGYIKINVPATELDAVKKLLDDGTLTPTEYENEVKRLKGSIEATKRDVDGNKLTAQTLPLDQLYALIETNVGNLQYNPEDTADEARATAYAKAEEFRKIMYDYSDDDTSKSATYNTVFGVKADGSVLANDTFKENTAVLDAIKELYDRKEEGVGALSNVVIAEDGAYVFFYAGDVENIFPNINENFDATQYPEYIRTLASTRLNIFSSQTVFDSIYSSLEKNDLFQTFQSLNADAWQVKFLSKAPEYIENNFEDLY